MKYILYDINESNEHIKYIQLYIHVICNSPTNATLSNTISNKQQPVVEDLFLLVRGLRQSYVNTSCSQYQGPFSTDHKERGSHARGVYSTQYTHLAHGNRKGDTRGRSRRQNNSKRVVRNLKEMDVGSKRKNA